MDEPTMRKLLDGMKQDLISQINSSKDDLRNEITAAIKTEVKEVSDKVDTNTKEINDIKKRLVAAEEKLEEKLYSDVVKSPTKNNTAEKYEKKDENVSEIEMALKAAKKKIGIKPVTIDDLDRIAKSKKVNGEECLYLAALEFLTEELKMDTKEIEELGKFKVTRKDIANNDKIYLHFMDEKSCQYISKKAVMCQNSNINIFPYIPPQLFRRFSDLSRNTFIARQSDKRLKTRINLGEKDLELKTKLKDVTEWETEPDLTAFGEIGEIDISIKWPNVEVKQVFSPPKGRPRKNVHNISDSSSEGSSPANKRTKVDEENSQKVQDFVKKLEAKQARKTKYTQAKTAFPLTK